MSGHNDEIRPWNYVTPPASPKHQSHKQPSPENKGLHPLTKLALIEKGLLKNNGPLRGHANVAATITKLLNPFGKARLHQYASATPARNAMQRMKHLRGIPFAARNMVTKRIRRVQEEEDRLREKEDRLLQKYEYEQVAIAKALGSLQEIEREKGLLKEQAVRLQKAANLIDAKKFLNAERKKQVHRNAARTRKALKHMKK